MNLTYNFRTGILAQMRMEGGTVTFSTMQQDEYEVMEELITEGFVEKIPHPNNFVYRLVSSGDKFRE